MIVKTTYRPALESLEDRLAPTVAYTFLNSGSNVLLSGTSTGPGLAVGVLGGDVSLDGVDSGVPAASVATFSLAGSTDAAALDLSGVSVADYTALTAATVAGGTGSDTLTLNDAAHLCSVTAANQGSVAGNYGLAFTSVENLIGGAGDDTFALTSNAAALYGTVDGGGGNNLLDYTGRTNGVLVNLNTGLAGATNGITHIENVTGGGGNDILFGDGASNVLSGGAGADILVGNGGDDTLLGGDGRDILIGGAGADSLDGGADDDILVAGTTNYDSNQAALIAIQREWTRTGVDYVTRVAHIDGTLGGGLNTAFHLNSTTVQDDGGAADTLTGGAGQDWFLTSTGDSVTDLDASETQTII